MAINLSDVQTIRELLECRKMFMEIHSAEAGGWCQEQAEKKVKDLKADNTGFKAKPGKG